MPKKFTSEKQKIGEVGENIASRFLMKQGFTILDRNYTKKWGELDIVAEKKDKIHFVEVKSVTRNNLGRVDSAYEEEALDSYQPEDNMHPWKLKRLSRALQSYILSKKLDEREWQVDLLVVFLDIEHKKAKIKVVKDIIL